MIEKPQFTLNPEPHKNRQLRGGNITLEAKVALLRNLGEEQVIIHKYFETASTSKLYFTKIKSNAPLKF